MFDNAAILNNKLSVCKFYLRFFVHKHKMRISINPDHLGFKGSHSREIELDYSYLFLHKCCLRKLL